MVGIMFICPPASERDWCKVSRGGVFLLLRSPSYGSSLQIILFAVFSTAYAARLALLSPGLVISWQNPHCSLSVLNASEVLRATITNNSIWYAVLYKVLFELKDDRSSLIVLLAVNFNFKNSQQLSGSFNPGQRT